MTEQAVLLNEILEESKSRGFLGPGSVVSQLEHARAFRRLLPGNGWRCLDLGSGGGLPGLVLAAEDTNEWVLLDAMHKRCQFLTEAVDQLDIADRVTVVCARAEIAGRDPEMRERFRAVVSRSFASPAVTAECASPFLMVGGNLIVADPPEGADRWPSAELTRVGLAQVRSLAEPHLTELQKTLAVDAEYPRRDGLPSRRPLW